MMGIGAFLGWQLCLLAIVMGFVLQTIPAIQMLIVQWIKNKQWVSLITGGLGAFFGLLPLAVMHSPLQYYLNYQTQLLITLVCLGLSIVSLFIFLRNVRQTESYTYLPLGPALILASFVCLFWGQAILNRLTQGL